ncbi:putative indole-3-acetic acid-amido synthetase GH3.9 [Tripterygium wilfordii]|uniref:Putative indole-3-acetic acid-amido synthetase GH3.9 n=1 Tax=Tripterygium wilfordii TaxID=458696 RepID=A0A7J7DCS4_TRIWF|nr:putative indole-3-acetic acid-amido synthetase GH3.9 [Tripterygium wilfordii]
MDGKKLEYKGEEALKEIENLTVNPAEVQESILKDILTRNSETEYLSKYLKGSKDVTEFKRHVPVITYKDIYPYIRRIANGEDSSLITGHPIVEMLCSSGTSGGEPKLMPSIAEDLDRRTFLYNLIMPIMNQYISGLDEGKAMQLYFVKAEMSTPCGLPARTVLTSYYKSKHFKCRTHDPFNDYTSPNQAILCNDSYQSMYCQLVSGLVHRQQVLRLGAVFASALLRSISFLERNWAKMCNDIRAGQLDSKITDPECRSCMSIMISSPDPSLADEIEEICSRSSWRGILCHLWPKAKYIEAVVTGSMGQYIPSLEYYSDGKLPLVSPMYASSECYFGVNLKPLCDPADVAFTLMPNMCYYEFLPLGENGTLLMQLDEEEEVPNDRLVDLVHVKVGSYYELVVTTYAGLHRYRIGDVLQVTGFHNRAPQFRFICRRNVVLSIDNDNTNEEDLHKSITVAKNRDGPDVTPMDAVAADDKTKSSSSRPRRDKRMATAKRGLRSLAVAVSIPLSMTFFDIYFSGSSEIYGARAKPFWFPPLWILNLSYLGSSFLMGLAAWLVWAEVVRNSNGTTISVLNLNHISRRCFKENGIKELHASAEQTMQSL